MADHTPTRVLVVEDEPILCLNAVDILEDAGFSVEMACNGDEAIDLLRSHPDLDVLFKNVRMPGSLDGVESAHHAAEHYPDIGVMVVSGYEPLDLHRLPPGAVFMAKPYETGTVIGSRPPGPARRLSSRCRASWQRTARGRRAKRRWTHR